MALGKTVCHSAKARLVVKMSLFFSYRRLTRENQVSVSVVEGLARHLPVFLAIAGTACHGSCTNMSPIAHSASADPGETSSPDTSWVGPETDSARPQGRDEEAERHEPCADPEAGGGLLNVETDVAWDRRAFVASPHFLEDERAARVAEVTNPLGLKLYAALASRAQTNLVLSPVAISNMIELISFAAHGSAQEQARRITGLDRVRMAALRGTLAKLAYAADPPSGRTFGIVGRLWVQSNALPVTDTVTTRDSVNFRPISTMSCIFSTRRSVFSISAARPRRRSKKSTVGLANEAMGGSDRD